MSTKSATSTIPSLFTSPTSEDGGGQVGGGGQNVGGQDGGGGGEEEEEEGGGAEHIGGPVNSFALFGGEHMSGFSSNALQEKRKRSN